MKFVRFTLIIINLSYKFFEVGIILEVKMKYL